MTGEHVRHHQTLSDTGDCRIVTATIHRTEPSRLTKAAELQLDALDVLQWHVLVKRRPLWECELWLLTPSQLSHIRGPLPGRRDVSNL